MKRCGCLVLGCVTNCWLHAWFIFSNSRHLMLSNKLTFFCVCLCLLCLFFFPLLSLFLYVSNQHMFTLKSSIANWHHNWSCVPLSQNPHTHWQPKVNKSSLSVDARPLLLYWIIRLIIWLILELINRVAGVLKSAVLHLRALTLSHFARLDLFFLVCSSSRHWVLWLRRNIPQGGGQVVRRMVHDLFYCLCYQRLLRSLFFGRYNGDTF